jgi:hypothetical protein
VLGCDVRGEDMDVMCAASRMRGIAIRGALLAM